MDLKTRVYFRDQFRAGRASALRDVEGFQELLFTLERLGVSLTQNISNLRGYEDAIQEVADQSSLSKEIPNQQPEFHLTFSVLYNLVREARNDALHQGALARHLTNNAILLALVLEDALMSKATIVDDFMVRDPICASSWQPVSLVRQQMLAHSFSYLPLLLEQDGQMKWCLLSDRNIAKYRRSGGENPKERLAKTVQKAIDARELETEDAECCASGTPICDVLKEFNGLPVLIVRSDQRDQLLGILTAFDLL